MRPPRFRLRTLMGAVAAVAVVIAIVPTWWWEAFHPRPVAPKFPTNRAEAVAYANYHFSPGFRRGRRMEISEVDPAVFGGRFMVDFVEPGRGRATDGNPRYLIMDIGYIMTVTTEQKKDDNPGK